MPLDKKKLQEAITIIKANRNSVTWDLQSSKAYRDAEDLLIEAAQSLLSGECFASAKKIEEIIAIYVAGYLSVEQVKELAKALSSIPRQMATRECPSCKGTGLYGCQFASPCLACKGTGHIPKIEGEQKCPYCDNVTEGSGGKYPYKLSRATSRVVTSPASEPIMKMPHYGYDLANKNYKQIIQNVWDKLNEIIEILNTTRGK